MLISEIFSQAKEANPQQVALEFGTTQFTYEQLDSLANRLANALVERGVKFQQRVGVYVDRTPLQVVAALAIWKINAVYIPFEYREVYSKRVLEAETEKLSLCACSFIISDIRNGSFDEFIEHSNSLNICNINVDHGEYQYPTETHIGLNFVASEITLSQSSEDNLAYIIFSSGSTAGVAKAIPISHYGLNYWYYALRETLNVDTVQHKVLANTIVEFDPHIWEYLKAWSAHGAIYLTNRQEQTDLLSITEIIYRKKITTLTILPLDLFELTRVGEDSLRKCQQALYVFITGESFTQSQVNSFVSLNPKLFKLFNAYGSTETTFGYSVRAYNPDESRENRLAITKFHPMPAIARQYAMYAILVKEERDLLIEVADDEEGEIIIIAPHINHYLSATQSQAILELSSLEGATYQRIQSIIDSSLLSRYSLFRSGDQFKQIGDCYYCIGRGGLQRQINIGGAKVDLKNCEDFISRIDGVQRAVMVANRFLYDKKSVYKERPLALVMLEPKGKKHNQALKMLIKFRKKLLWGLIYVVDSIQRTERQKTDIKFYNEEYSSKLPERQREILQRNRNIGDSDYRVRLEREVINLVADELGSKNYNLMPDDFVISVDDTLYQLGCTSLCTKQLSIRIAKQFNCDPHHFIVDQDMTIAELSGVVYSTLRQHEPYEIYIENLSRSPDADAEIVFLIHPITGSVGQYTQLASLFEGKHVIAIKAPGLIDPEKRICSLPALAEHYTLGVILRIQPKGPYTVVGWSTGGLLALEIGRLLKKRKAHCHCHVIDSIRTKGFNDNSASLEYLTKMANTLANLYSINMLESMEVEGLSLKQAIKLLFETLRSQLPAHPTSQNYRKSLAELTVAEDLCYANIDLQSYWDQLPCALLNYYPKFHLYIASETKAEPVVVDNKATLGWPEQMIDAIHTTQKSNHITILGNQEFLQALSISVEASGFSSMLQQSIKQHYCESGIFNFVPLLSLTNQALKREHLPTPTITPIFPDSEEPNLNHKFSELIGNSGSGKTWYVRIMLYDWVKGNVFPDILSFDQFKLVFYIDNAALQYFLSKQEIKRGITDESIADFLINTFTMTARLDVFPGQQVKESFVRLLQRDNASNQILLVIDGLPISNKEVACFLHALKQLPAVKVLTTNHALQIIEDESVSEYHCLGFSKLDAERHINSNSNELGFSEASKQRVLSHLRSSHIGYCLPVELDVLQTLTYSYPEAKLATRKVYRLNLLFDFLLNRYLQRALFSHIAFQLLVTPELQQGIMLRARHALGELAYRTVLSGHNTFTLNQIEDCFQGSLTLRETQPNSIMGVLTLSLSAIQSDQLCYQFISETIRVLCVAEYVHTSNSTKRISDLWQSADAGNVLSIRKVMVYSLRLLEHNPERQRAFFAELVESYFATDNTLIISLLLKVASSNFAPLFLSIAKQEDYCLKLAAKKRLNICEIQLLTVVLLHNLQQPADEVVATVRIPAHQYQRYLTLLLDQVEIGGISKEVYALLNRVIFHYISYVKKNSQFDFAWVIPLVIQLKMRQDQLDYPRLLDEITCDINVALVNYLDVFGLLLECFAHAPGLSSNIMRVAWACVTARYARQLIQADPPVHSRSLSLIKHSIFASFSILNENKQNRHRYDTGNMAFSYLRLASKSVENL